MHTLEADRQGPFSTDYTVTRDGALVTTLDLARLRQRGEFQLEGETYTLRREGMLGARVVLERAGATVLRAERAGFLPIRYMIRAADRMLALRPRLPLRTYVVRHGDRDIATIRPRRPFSRSAIAEFSEELPLATEIFIVALVLLRWRARARAAK